MNCIRAMARALRVAAENNPGAAPEEIAEVASDLFHDWMEDAARERESIEDTPCLESCDQWGAGEGRYHGVIS
jgi:hypothetical protein